MFEFGEEQNNNVKQGSHRTESVVTPQSGHTDQAREQKTVDKLKMIQVAGLDRRAIR